MIIDLLHNLFYLMIITLNRKSSHFYLLIKNIDNISIINNHNSTQDNHNLFYFINIYLLNFHVINKKKHILNNVIFANYIHIYFVGIITLLKHYINII